MECHQEGLFFAIGSTASSIGTLFYLDFIVCLKLWGFLTLDSLFSTRGCKMFAIYFSNCYVRHLKSLTIELRGKFFSRFFGSL